MLKRLVPFLMGFLSGALIIGGIIERMCWNSWADGGPSVCIGLGCAIGALTLIAAAVIEENWL